MAQRGFRRGVVWKSGKLYLFDTEAWVVRGWPRPMAWCKPTAHDPWRHARPPFPFYWSAILERFGRPGPDEPPVAAPCPEARGDVIQLPLPFPALPRPVVGREALAAFFKGYPRDALRLARRLPDRHYHVLALMARCPGAKDLVRGAPALAWCLASSWVFHQPRVTQPMRAARSLVRKKQGDILQWLGFPGSASAARIVRRVEPGCVSVARMLSLRAGLSDPQVAKRLSHAPILGAGVIDLLCQPRLRALGTSRLLAEVASTPNEIRRSPTAGRLHHVLRVHEALPGSGPLGRFRSRNQVRECLRELHARARHERLRHWLDFEFPPPPLPPVDGIEPLRNPTSVIEEAERQHHCAASFIPEIAAGETYFYRVLAPSRATLAVVPRGTGWAVGDLRAACNGDPGEATRQRVGSWLRQEVPSTTTTT